MDDVIAYIRLDELVRWELNPKEHDLKLLKHQIRANGFVVPLNVRDHRLFAGHGRFQALIEIKAEGPQPADTAWPPQYIRVDHDGEWLVPCIPLDHLTLEQAHQHAITDNVVNQRGTFNPIILKEIFKRDLVKQEETGFSKKQLRRVDQWGQKEKPRRKLRFSKVADVPDALFPAEPEYGIPLLSLKGQANYVDRPFIKWGSQKRTTEHRGTVHFYTDDYKFAALYKNPLKLIDTQCVTAVEPNFSTHPQMPLYEVLYRIGQKRFMARLWQEEGLRILVDLNVDPQFRSYNLLGVPIGWKAYCTRALVNKLEALQLDFNTAADHAGSEDILFVVYGGNADTEKFCALKGWVWIPEFMDAFNGA